MGRFREFVFFLAIILLGLTALYGWEVDVNKTSLWGSGFAGLSYLGQMLFAFVLAITLMLAGFRLH